MPVEHRVEDTGRVDEVNSARPLMVFDELIEILGWIGDPAAGSLFAAALASGIKDVRRPTLEAVTNLNCKEEPVLRALLAMLESSDKYQEDVLVKERAAAAILFLLNGKPIAVRQLRRSERGMLIDAARERVAEEFERIGR